MFNLSKIKNMMFLYILHEHFFIGTVILNVYLYLNITSEKGHRLTYSYHVCVKLTL